MWESLSEREEIHRTAPERRAAALASAAAVGLSVVLAAAAVVDQVGGRGLVEHASALYAPYGKRADPGLLYGLVYAVAAIGAALWLLVLRAVRSRLAPALAAVVTAVTAALAVLLLASTEYGGRIFPPLWGILALLPAAAGVLAVVLLLRRSDR
jgi:hypothetical protein